MSTRKPSLRRLGVGRRRAVSVSNQSLVRTEPLEPGRDLPLLIRPNLPGVRLATWAETHRSLINDHLAKHGGILFRGFDLAQVEEFEEAVRAISGELLEYKERSSPRSPVKDRVYTSTDYPADQPIFLHNENSYQQVWPLRIFFFCHTPPGKGGETPIADVRRVYEKIGADVRERFMERGWSYVRNFGDGFGLHWKTVFQTEDSAVVDEYCRQNRIQTEWKQGDRLRTRSVRPAVAKHPETGDLVWFNHATFFHLSTLPEPVQKAISREFAREDLPANSYYGDESEIETEVLDELRSVYHSETVSFPWQKGDLLMLDNMLVAHGRAPFEGDRKILVAMCDPCSWDRVHGFPSPL